MFAPARTPAAIVMRVNQEAVKVLAQPDVKQKFFNTGVETAGRARHDREHRAIDLDAVGKAGNAVDVIRVAMGFDQVGDGLGRQLGDLGNQGAAGFRRDRGIDHHHAAVSDQDAGIAAAAL